MVRGFVDRFEVTPGHMVELRDMSGGLRRMPTSLPEIRLSIVLQADPTNEDHKHFFDTLQAGCREICMDVTSTPFIRPTSAPLALSDAPVTDADAW